MMAGSPKTNYMAYCDNPDWLPTAIGPSQTQPSGPSLCGCYMAAIYHPLAVGMAD